MSDDRLAPEERAVVIRDMHLTPQERVVLEVAESFTSHRETCPIGRESCTACTRLRVELDKAVRALRESRKPKPKWHVKDDEIIKDDGMIRLVVYRSDSQPAGIASNIADLLNRAEQK